MFEILFLQGASDEYDRLRTLAMKAKAKTKSKTGRQQGLFQQIAKTLTLLASNPKHPGLNTHEYSNLVNPFDKKAKVFEAYAQNATPGAYRVFWCYGPQKKQITIIAITPHP